MNCLLLFYKKIFIALMKSEKFLIFLALLCLTYAPTLASATPILEEIAPIGYIYTEGIDFSVFNYAASGDVTAQLQSVPGIGESTDFTNFILGNIALIERGGETFLYKVMNAEVAGATGVIIYNNIDGLVNGTLGSPLTSIPSVSVSRVVGLDLLNQLGSYDQVNMHIFIPEPIPEPATMLLLGTGLVGVAGAARRKKKNQA